MVTPVVTWSAASLPITTTSLVINGTGFDLTPGNDAVALNVGAAGTVTAATGIQLTVSCTTQPTSVGNLTAVVTTNGVSSEAAVQVAAVDPVATMNTGHGGELAGRDREHGRAADCHFDDHDCRHRLLDDAALLYGGVQRR